MNDALRSQLDKDRREIAKALDETIDETIRQSWAANTIAWLGVVGLAFLVNLALLVLVAGGR